MLGSGRKKEKIKGGGKEMRALILAIVLFMTGCAGMDYNRYMATSNYLQSKSNASQLQQMRTQHHWNNYQVQRNERMRRFGLKF